MNNKKEAAISRIYSVCRKLGYTFDESSYINAKSKYTVYCDRGHLREISETGQIEKYRCKKCVKEDAAEKVTNKFMELAKLENFQVLVEVEGWKEKTKILCPKDHYYEATYKDWVNGNRCPYCSKKKLYPDEVRSEFKENGYTIKEEGKVYYKVVCPEGHDWLARVHSFRRGIRCPICKSTKKTIEEVSEAFSVEGLEVISTSYDGAFRKLEVKCSENHKFMINWSDFTKGSRCPICNITKPEREIKEWLESIGIKYIYRDRSGKYEIDFLLPEHKIGIELHGLYWHCEDHKPKNYHLHKLQDSLTRNINLIQIFEDEWDRRNDQVKGFIESKLGLCEKIFARKTIFKEISKEECKNFLDKYHIQGSVQSNYECGLYYNEELVQVMTFGKHHRQNSESLLLSRMCSKRGFNVVGGSSKLIKGFIKLQNIKNIVTFADRRYSEGGVYENIGFRKTKVMGPDYSYFKNGKRHSKQSMKKKANERSLGITEKELRASQGYKRIFDCGKIRFEYVD